MGGGTLCSPLGLWSPQKPGLERVKRIKSDTSGDRTYGARRHITATERSWGEGKGTESEVQGGREEREEREFKVQLLQKQKKFANAPEEHVTSGSETQVML